MRRGTYTESISMISGMALYGGFAGSESVLTERTPAVNPAVIDGGGAAHTVVMDGLTSAVLNGFIVRGGEATTLGRRRPGRRRLLPRAGLEQLNC